MKNALTIERVFDAPVELVWQAWTDEKHIPKWFGPKGFTTKVNQHDFFPGGRWEYIMVDDSNGNEYPAIGVFQEIVEHQKITSTDESDEMESAHVAGYDFPKVLLFTTLFEVVGNKTKLTLVYEHPSEEEKQKHINLGVEGGWNSSLDKLVEFLSSK